MIEEQAKREAVSNSEVELSPRSIDRSSQTFFSTLDFAEAWSRYIAGAYATLALPVRGSGPSRTIYAVQTLGSNGRRSIFLGPHGLYGSPGWQGTLESSTLKEFASRLMGFRTSSFVWNVRFDHQLLASGLSSLGLKFERTATQVLHLSEYDEIFTGYNATIRNQVRKARRLSVRVRATDKAQDLEAYYRIHLQRVEKRGGYSFIFPLEFLQRLIKLGHRARFLVAESGEQIVAGGLFLRDGCSVFYLHGAHDNDFAHLFPSCAVIDEAIRWACENGATFFNFGGSGGIASLERFKSFWGARQEQNWHFEWRNPFWLRLSRLKGAVKANRTSEGSSPSGIES